MAAPPPPCVSRNYRDSRVLEITSGGNHIVLTPGKEIWIEVHITLVEQNVGAAPPPSKPREHHHLTRTPEPIQSGFAQRIALMYVKDKSLAFRVGKKFNGSSEARRNVAIQTLCSIDRRFTCKFLEPPKERGGGRNLKLGHPGAVSFLETTKWITNDPRGFSLCIHVTIPPWFA